MADTETTLDGLVDALEKAQERADALKQVIDSVRQEITARLREQGVTSTTTEAGRKITIVTGQTTSWDMDLIKDILIPLDLWDRVRVVTEVVDEGALERLVDQGAIAPDRLQPAMTVREKRPYPRITDTNHRRNARD